jgi:hypothetical protein
MRCISRFGARISKPSPAAFYKWTTRAAALYRLLVQHLPADAARRMEEGAVALREVERTG